MRRTSFALLALALLLPAGAVEAQTLKIAYINSQEILLQAPGADEALVPRRGACGADPTAEVLGQEPALVHAKAPPLGVADDAARLLHDADARRVVPNLLAVVLGLQHAQGSFTAHAEFGFVA